VGQLLDLDLLVKQMALAFGAAMVLGNSFAIIQHKRGVTPKGETGQFRSIRAYWLLSAGLVIAVWGAASLLTG
jgi:hypothetical protein